MSEKPKKLKGAVFNTKVPLHKARTQIFLLSYLIAKAHHNAGHLRLKGVRYRYAACACEIGFVFWIRHVFRLNTHKESFF